MYQAIHYDNKTREIYLWDDEYDDVIVEPFVRKVFVRDPLGTHETIFGEKVSQIEGIDGFEKDVQPQTAFLVDRYLMDSTPSTKHVNFFFDIEVSMIGEKPDTKKGNNTITSISAWDSKTLKWWVVLLDPDAPETSTQTHFKGQFAEVLTFKTERKMLSYFMRRYHEISPTILTGWNIDGFDIPYLYHRMKRILQPREIQSLGKIGKGVYYDSYKDSVNIPGVNTLDYMKLYQKYAMHGVLPSYSLEFVCQLELKRGKVKYEGTLDTLWKNDKEKFVEYNLTDVELVVALDEKLKYIELCRSICHVSHTPYNEYQLSSRLMDGAILVELHQMNMCAPNKKANQDDEDINPNLSWQLDDSEDQFEGAYVMEPIPGRYKWAFSVDAKSLYPSIIRTANISYETIIGKVELWQDRCFVNRKEMADLFKEGDIESTVFGERKIFKSHEEVEAFVKKNNLTITTNGCLYTKDKMGIIPKILTQWFAKRQQFQKEAEKVFGTPEYNYWDTLQYTWKILLNSMYGALGLPSFRYYNRDNAEAVTLSGQSVIKFANKILDTWLSEKFKNKSSWVRYNDTDSAYCELPLGEAGTVPQAVEIADAACAYLNTMMPLFSTRQMNSDNNQLIFSRERVCSPAIFVKKKRYALKVVDKEGKPPKPGQEIKITGLDVVRSTFPFAFKDSMMVMIKMLLDEKSPDEILTYISGEVKKTNKLPAMQLAKGSTVKEMDKWNANGIERSKFDSLPGCPAHYKAALSYNDLLETVPIKDKHLFTSFSNFDKVRWVYLKKNPYGLKTLAFPMYDCPPEITAHADMYVDRTKMWESEMVNKVRELLVTIGEKVPDGDYVEKKVLDEYFG